MNENHKRCGSEGWRALVRHTILPWALADVDLGEDVLEVGPGYGATTDVLAESAPTLTAVEIDDELAAMLTNRFAGNRSVVIDPELLPERLEAAGFDAVDVRTNEFGWIAQATRI